jgi:hypothetical protein
MAWLTRAVHAGFADAAQLSDDFADQPVVCDRPDFKELVAKLRRREPSPSTTSTAPS